MRLERKRLALSAGDVAYVDEGEGPAVVLLHGYPTSAHLWRDLVPMLAPRFRAIAPDLLGYGDSEKPEDADLTVRAQARYVHELLERLGVDACAVVAHDIGGGVAQLLALDGGVRTMILVDSVAFDAWPIEGVRMLQAMEPQDADPSFAEQLLRTTFDLGMTQRPRLADEDLEEYTRPWRTDPPALIRAARGIDGVGLTGIDERLAALEFRSLVLWGEDDPFLPPQLAERLGDVLEMASVATLPGCSHFLTEDAPETVLPLIAEWLRSQYLGEGHGHSGPQLVDLGVSFERPQRPSVPEGFEDLEEG